MFRATHRPSSGTQNCTGSLWFCIHERLLDAQAPSNLSTCWALYKHGIINFDTLLHLVGYFYMKLTQCICWGGRVERKVFCHTCRSVCWLNWFCMDMRIWMCTVHCGSVAIREWVCIVQWEDWDLERQEMENSRWRGEWRVVQQVVGKQWVWMVLWYKHTCMLFGFIASRYPGASCGPDVVS